MEKHINPLDEAVAGLRRLLKEHGTELIKALCEEFGQELVFSGARVYNPIDTDVSSIFDIINEIAFTRRLRKIPVKTGYAPDFAAEAKSRNGGILVWHPQAYEKVIGSYFVTVSNDSEIKSGLAVKPIFKDDDLIMLNAMMLGRSAFMLTVAAVYHEMIHLYDRTCGEFPVFAAEEVRKGEYVDKHSTPTFEREMDRAHELDVNVKKDMSGMTKTQMSESSLLYMPTKEELEQLDESGGETPFFTDAYLPQKDGGLCYVHLDY